MRFRILLCICLPAFATVSSQTFNPDTVMQPSTGNVARVDADTVVLSKRSGRSYTLTVLDVLGRQVLNRPIDSAVFILSGCAFRKGAYTYLISDDKKRVVRRGAFRIQYGSSGF